MNQTPEDPALPLACSDGKPKRVSHDVRCTQVIEAAIYVFSLKGFQGTTTKEIADVAGINEALIFRYFHSKQKLYTAIIEYASTRIDVDAWLRTAALKADTRDDLDVFGFLAHKLLDAFRKQGELYRLMLYSALKRHDLRPMFRARQFGPLKTFVVAYIRSRQDDGAFVDLDPAWAAKGFLSLCYHEVLLGALFDEYSASAEIAAVNLTHLYLNGIRCRPKQLCDSDPSPRKDS